MEHPVFYVPPENQSDEILKFPPPEARHASLVLRLKPGAMVVVVDGAGSAKRGELVTVSRTKVTFRCHSEQRNFGEPSVRLTLAAGMSTGEKFDTVVQQGTELGVKRFVPILSEKSKVKLETAVKQRARVRRLERVALAAIKQSRRSYLPEIASPLTLNQYLTEQNEDDLKLLFHPGASGIPLDGIDIADDTKRITVLVGSEAGFSDDEVMSATDAGFVPVTLGARILRSQTAAPVAVALAMQRLGEFR